MKKIKLLVFLFGLTFAVSCGQQKRYISYKVQEGDTIESLAKRLNISSQELLRLNPDVSTTLATNAVIIIPNKNIKKEKNNSTNIAKDSITTAVKDTITNNPNIHTSIVTSYNTHTVKQGETVYKITKEHNVTKEELLALNPEYPDLAFNKLSINQVLKVKAITKTITVTKDEIEKEYVTHTVSSKETVYGITRFYNISKTQLVALNPEYPEIENNLLKIGQFLKIKRKNNEEETITQLFYKDSISENSPINIALLLPFKAKEYDSLTAKEIFKKNKLANMVTDYYLGAEMAIDSLQKQGVTINTKLYDTGKKNENIQNIIANKNLEKTNAIIGPFYFEEAIAVSKAVDAPVIFPHFSSKQTTYSAKNLIKTVPNKLDNATFLASYIKENYTNETIFIVSDAKKVSKKITTRIKEELYSTTPITQIHVLEPKDGYIKKERFTKKLTKNTKAIVIIATTDKVIIADALNSSIGFPDDNPVQVFAVEKNKAYSNIENNKLASINFSYVCTNYADENTNELTLFNKKYLEKNKALPSNYAVKGFDTTYDIIMRLASSKKLQKTFKEGISFRLETKFDYRKKTFGNYKNYGLYLIKYNKDLSLTRLK